MDGSYRRYYLHHRSTRIVAVPHTVALSLQGGV